MTADVLVETKLIAHMIIHVAKKHRLLTTEIVRQVQTDIADETSL
jgi:hypothetical protein